MISCSETNEKNNALDKPLNPVAVDTNNYALIETKICSGTDGSFWDWEIEYFGKNGLPLKRENLDSLGKIISTQYLEFNLNDRLISTYILNRDGDTSWNQKFSYYEANRLQVCNDGSVAYFFQQNEFGNTIHKVGFAPDTSILENVFTTYDQNQQKITEKSFGFYTNVFKYNDHNLLEYMTVNSDAERVKNRYADNQDFQHFFYEYEYNDSADWTKKTTTLISETDSSGNFPIISVTTRRIVYNN